MSIYTRRNPYREQPRNIHGERLTLKATVDKRQHRTFPRDNEGLPYCYYDVLETPGDKRPWYVICVEVNTGYRYRVAKYVTRAKAERAAERFRIAQPNRNPSLKKRHKLGLT